MTKNIDQEIQKKQQEDFEKKVKAFEEDVRKAVDEHGVTIMAIIKVTPTGIFPELTFIPKPEAPVTEEGEVVEDNKRGAKDPENSRPTEGPVHDNEPKDEPKKG